MRTISTTKFNPASDTKELLKRMAESINRVEKTLGLLPISFGDFDPNGQVVARSGAIHIRTGSQGVNQGTAIPKLYIKTTEGGSDGWLSLVFIGTQASTEVSANRGSLYIKVPESGTANIYFKQTDDATPTGWASL